MNQILPFIAIILALVLGYAVTVQAHRPKHDREYYKRRLAEAEKRHAPKAHLRRDLESATMLELRREQRFPYFNIFRRSV